MKDTHQLGLLDKPLQYHNLDGIYNYYQILGTNYPKYAFLTPVEIFQPWYGYALASYCLDKKKSPYLTFLEIGGGTGTCALSILDFYKKHSIRSYNTISYTICEISPVLSQISAKRIKEAHPELWKNGNVKVLNMSAIDWNIPIKQQVYVIGLEVLDNMPHDKIQKVNGQWKLQTKITENLEEITEEINDELIQKCLKCYLEMPAKSLSEIEIEHKEGFLYNILAYWNRPRNKEVLFLPTMAYKLIGNLCGKLENPDFIFSDFDSLPKNKIRGIYAPIVSKKGFLAHEAEDYDTYLANFGNVDIFFPVDFRLIQQFYREFKGKSGLVLKSYRFMNDYAKNNWTKVKTGYRPLFDDFRNTSFFISGQS